MPSDTFMNEMKDRLTARREELRAEREDIDRRRKVLHEPEIEMEEQAQKEKMALKLEQQDERTRDELKLVNDALVRMEAGAWGVCESCGKDIKEPRLEAVPWTKTCMDCAGEEVPSAPVATPDVNVAPLPPEYQGMNDEELAGAVLEELRNDGRVELDDLNVTARGGVVVLSGELPSNRRHEVLIEVVHDIMGITAYEDNTRVDRQAFQRRDRTDDMAAENPSESEKPIEGEPVEEDPWAARGDGGHTAPADRMVPEKDKK